MCMQTARQSHCGIPGGVLFQMHGAYARQCSESSAARE
jgi:hypothetical protein